MRKLLLAALVMSLAQITTIYAADAPRGPAANWTGVHIGINGGYGWGTVSASNASIANGGTTVALPDASANLSGGFAGGSIGYDHQLGNFVIGVETDLQGGLIEYKHSASAFGATVEQRFALDTFGTTRARAGIAFNDF